MVNTERCMIPIVKSPQDYQAYRISSQDTNRLAIVFDPSQSAISLTVCVEIFEVGGKTPLNRYQLAVELFLSSRGRGRLPVMAKPLLFGLGIVSSCRRREPM